MQQQSMVGVDYIRQKTDLTESDLDLLEIRDPLDHIKMPGAEARLYNLDAVEYLQTLHKETRTAMHCRLLQWNDQTIQRFDDECKQVMACWQPPKSILNFSSGSRLPSEVWSQILGHLSDDLQLDDIRGASVIARELCNASMASKELYAASLPAFQKLSNLCDKMELEDKWQGLLSDPWNQRLVSDIDILDLLEDAGLRAFGSRSIRICMLYEVVQQSKPTRLPARLILAVREEKRSRPASFQLICRMKAFNNCQSEFQFKKNACKFGISSLDMLVTLCLRAERYYDHKLKAAEARQQVQELCHQIAKAHETVRKEEQSAHMAHVEFCKDGEHLSTESFLLEGKEPEHTEQQPSHKQFHSHNLSQLHKLCESFVKFDQNRDFSTDELKASKKLDKRLCSGMTI